MTDKYGLSLNNQRRTQSVNYPYADLTPEQRTGARYAGIGGLPPDLRPPDGATQRQQPGILDRLGQRIREAPQRAAARREKAAGIYDSLNRTAEDYAQRIRGLAVQQGGGVRGGAAATGQIVRDFATAPVRGYGLLYDEVAKPAAQVVTQNVTGPFVDALTGNTQQAGAGAAPAGLGLLPTAQASPTPTPATAPPTGLGLPQALQGAPDITRQVQGGQTTYQAPQGTATFQGTPGAYARGLGLAPGGDGWQRLMGAGQPGGLPAGGGYSGAATDAEALANLQARGIDTSQRDAFGNVRMPATALAGDLGTVEIDAQTGRIRPGLDMQLTQARRAALDRGDFAAFDQSYMTPDEKRRARLERAALRGNEAALGLLGLAGDQSKAQQAAAQQDFENNLALEGLGLDRERLGLDRKKADQKAGDGTDLAAAVKTGVAQMIADGFESDKIAEYLDRQLGSLSKVLGQPVFFYQGEVITQAEIAETAKRDDVKAAAAKAGVAPTAFVMDLLRKQGGFYQPGEGG